MHARPSDFERRQSSSHSVRIRYCRRRGAGPEFHEDLAGYESSRDGRLCARRDTKYQQQEKQEKDFD
jgi:hypothetical protein